MDHQKTKNEETVARLSSNLGILCKKKEKNQFKDAARFRASVETDPANDMESKEKPVRSPKQMIHGSC